MLLKDLFINHARIMKNRRVAYKYEFGEFTEVYCEEFHQDCRRAVSFWNEIAGNKRCKIGIVAENSYIYLIQVFGIILSGNIAIPMNQNMSHDDLCGFLEELEVDALAADDDWVEELKEFADSKKIIITNIEDAFSNSSETAIIERQVKEDDLSLILLSSGTSGRSKAVQLSQRNLIASSRRFYFENKECQQNVLQVLPLYHIGGISLSLEELMRGNSLLISNAKYYMMQVERFEIQKLILVPAMAQNLFNKAEDKEGIKAGLRTAKEMLCVGAALHSETIAKMREFNIAPVVYYGMTETAGTVSGEGEYRDGACGIIVSHNEVKIENDEILIRGENITCGYINNEEATKELLKDGWLHTGDLGKIDEDGYLYLIGRSKNIIILSNGENVSPEELEEKLYKCSDIVEALVYGKDEIICATVYCGEDFDEDKEKSVREYIKSVNKSLPTTKKIKEINFSKEELPKSSLGKIKR